jgi:hypothetical protein
MTHRGMRGARNQLISQIVLILARKHLSISNLCNCLTDKGHQFVTYKVHVNVNKLLGGFDYGLYLHLNFKDIVDLVEKILNGHHY